MVASSSIVRAAPSIRSARGGALSGHGAALFGRREPGRSPNQHARACGPAKQTAPLGGQGKRHYCRRRRQEAWWRPSRMVELGPCCHPPIYLSIYLPPPADWPLISSRHMKLVRRPSIEASPSKLAPTQRPAEGTDPQTRSVHLTLSQWQTHTEAKHAQLCSSTWRC